MKYLSILKVSFQEQAAYPARFFATSLFSLVVLTMFFFLVQAWYLDQAMVAGFGKIDMLTYYAVTFLLVQLTVSGSVAKTISQGIQSGELSTFLIKPVSYNGYLFCKQLLVKGLKTAIPMMVVIGLLVMTPELFSVPKQLDLFLISVVLATLINYFVYASIGTVAFWTVSSSGILQIFSRLLDVLGGSLFPLDLLPGWVQQLLEYLPFQYMHYVTVAIYLGRFESRQAVEAVLVQALWCVVLAFVYAYFWRKGSRRYDAVGN
jgi:ABC-2 type transport system permease protein